MRYEEHNNACTYFIHMRCANGWRRENRASNEGWRRIMILIINPHFIDRRNNNNSMQRQKKREKIPVKQKINTVCGSVQICKNFIRLRLPTCNSIESNIILLIIIHTICTRIMIAIIIKYILLHSILRSNFFFLLFIAIFVSVGASEIRFQFVFSFRNVTRASMEVLLLLLFNTRFNQLNV